MLMSNNVNYDLDLKIATDEKEMSYQGASTEMIE